MQRGFSHLQHRKKKTLGFGFQKILSAWKKKSASQPGNVSDPQISQETEYFLVQKEKKRQFVFEGNPTVERVGVAQKF